MKQYDTPEEAYAAHIQRVIQWQKDNPEKVKEYHRTYYKSDKVKARRQAKYNALTPEQKEAKLAKQRDRYKNMDPVAKEAYRETQRILSRAKYKRLKDDTK